MLKEWRKAGEIKETLQAIGEVEEGDNYFKEAVKLKSELSEIRKSMAKKALIIIGAIVVGAAAIVNSLSSNEEEQNFNSGGVTSTKADIPMESSETDVHDDPCKLDDQELRRRTIRTFELGRDDSESKDLSDLDNLINSRIRDIATKWYKELIFLNVIHKNDLSKRMLSYFCESAVPIFVPAEEERDSEFAQYKVSDEQFLISRSAGDGFDPKSRWLIENEMPFTDGRILYLPSDQPHYLSIFIAMLQLIPDLEDDPSTLASLNEIYRNELKKMDDEYQSHLLLIKSLDTKRFDFKLNFQYSLNAMAQSSLMPRGTLMDAGKAVRGKFFMIAIILRSIISWPKPVAEWLDEIIRNPSLINEFDKLIDDYSSDSLVRRLMERRERFLIQPPYYGKLVDPHAKDSKGRSLLSQEIRNFQNSRIDPIDELKNSEFRTFLYSVVIPLIREIGLLNNSKKGGHSFSLGEFFVNYLIVDMQPSSISKRFAKSNEFIIISPLENLDKMDERAKWMEEHGIPFYNFENNVMLVSSAKLKYPVKAGTFGSDVAFILNQAAGWKKHIETNIKYTSGFDPLLEYADSYFRPKPGLDKLNVEELALIFFIKSLKYRAMSEISRQFNDEVIVLPDGVSQSEAYKIKILAVEAHLYRMIMALLDHSRATHVSSYSYAELSDNLQEILNNPQNWLNLSESDKKEHDLFKFPSVHK